MKSIFNIIIALYASIAVASTSMTEAGVREFLNNWIIAQNTGSYYDYASMYSKTFTGIRRTESTMRKMNYEAWLKDRRLMFGKIIIVKANNPQINVTGTSATIKFTQTWESGSYKDIGDKVIILALEDGKMRITKEEMLFSKKMKEQKTENIKLKIPANESNSVVDKATNKNMFKSQFTSLREKDCTKLPENMRIFLGYDNAIDCPAPKGWRLIKVYDSERSLITIAHGNSIWFCADIIDDEKNDFGYAPNIYAQRVEWRITKSGEPSALIFRVAAQDRENNLPISRLFVISLQGMKPRFCGVAKDSQLAKDIADKALSCTSTLREKKMPAF